MGLEETVRGTVLIVENYDLVLDLAKRVLSKRGYNTLTSTDGDGAIARVNTELINGREVHALILNINLPGKDGVTVYEEVQEMYRLANKPCPPVIFMISDPIGLLYEKAKGLGTVLTKTGENAPLTTAVNTAVEQYKQLTAKTE